MKRRIPGTYLNRPDDAGGEGGGAAPERPEWLEDRYQTAEDQAKAYSEARAEMNRMRSTMEQERSTMAAALERIEAQTQAPAPVQVQPSDDPAILAYQRAYEEGDAQAMLRLGAQFTQGPLVEAVGRLLDDRFEKIQPALEATNAAQREAQIRMAEDIVARQIGPEKYQELLPQISSALQDHQHWLPQVATTDGYANAILDVAKLVEHDTLTKTVAELEAERAEKMAAQTVAGAGRGSVYSRDQQQAEVDRIKAAPTDSYASMMARRS